MHSLIGPNGAGKTTVLNCVSGFLQPDAGHVVMDGIEVTRSPPHRLVAAGLVRTFQITNIFTELTIREMSSWPFVLAWVGILTSFTKLTGFVRLTSGRTKY